MKMKKSEFENFGHSVGQVPAIASVETFAVYDRQDGRVAHMHQVVTFVGAEARDPAEHERNALRLAGEFGHDIARLKTLRVPQHRGEGGELRVDLERLELVALPEADHETIGQRPGESA
jgi:hypothetical protein